MHIARSCTLSTSLLEFTPVDVENARNGENMQVIIPHKANLCLDMHAVVGDVPFLAPLLQKECASTFVRRVLLDSPTCRHVMNADQAQLILSFVTGFERPKASSAKWRRQYEKRVAQHLISPTQHYAHAGKHHLVESHQLSKLSVFSWSLCLNRLRTWVLGQPQGTWCLSLPCTTPLTRSLLTTLFHARHGFGVEKEVGSTKYRAAHRPVPIHFQGPPSDRHRALDHAFGSLRQPLFAHQCDEVAWMASLERVSEDGRQALGVLSTRDHHFVPDTANANGDGHNDDEDVFVHVHRDTGYIDSINSRAPPFRKVRVRGGILASSTGTGKTHTIMGLVQVQRDWDKVRAVRAQRGTFTYVPPQVVASDEPHKYRHPIGATLCIASEQTIQQHYRHAVAMLASDMKVRCIATLKEYESTTYEQIRDDTDVIFVSHELLHHPVYQTSQAYFQTKRTQGFSRSRDANEHTDCQMEEDDAEEEGQRLSYAPAPKRSKTGSHPYPSSATPINHQRQRGDHRNNEEHRQQSHSCLALRRTKRARADSNSNSNTMCIAAPVHISVYERTHFNLDDFIWARLIVDDAHDVFDRDSGNKTEDATFVAAEILSIPAYFRWFVSAKPLFTTSNATVATFQGVLSLLNVSIDDVSWSDRELQYQLTRSDGWERPQRTEHPHHPSTKSLLQTALGSVLEDFVYRFLYYRTTKEQVCVSQQQPHAIFRSAAGTMARPFGSVTTRIVVAPTSRVEQAVEAAYGILPRSGSNEIPIQQFRALVKSVLDIRSSDESTLVFTVATRLQSIAILSRVYRHDLDLDLDIDGDVNCHGGDNVVKRMLFGAVVGAGGGRWCIFVPDLAPWCPCKEMNRRDTTAWLELTEMSVCPLHACPIPAPGITLCVYRTDGSWSIFDGIGGNHFHAANLPLPLAPHIVLPARDVHALMQLRQFQQCCMQPAITATAQWPPLFRSLTARLESEPLKIADVVKLEEDAEYSASMRAAFRHVCHEASSSIATLLWTIRRILRANAQHRILVFSSHPTREADVLRDWMIKVMPSINIEHGNKRTTTTSTLRALDSFHKGDVSIVFLSTHDSDSLHGVDILTATHVVMLNSCYRRSMADRARTEQVERHFMQSLDRVVQTKSIELIRIVQDHPIELRQFVASA